MLQFFECLGRAILAVQPIGFSVRHYCKYLVRLWNYNHKKRLDLSQSFPLDYITLQHSDIRPLTPLTGRIFPNQIRRLNYGYVSPETRPG